MCPQHPLTLRPCHASGATLLSGDPPVSAGTVEAGDFRKAGDTIYGIDTMYIDTICRIYIYVYLFIYFLVEEMFGVNDFSLSHSWAAAMICIQNLGS